MGNEAKQKELIPVFHVTGRCLPEAWEKALLSVWEGGVEIQTEYAAKDDPLSLDAAVVVDVKEPFGETGIH